MFSLHLTCMQTFFSFMNVLIQGCYDFFLLCNCKSKRSFFLPFFIYLFIFLKLFLRLLSPYIIIITATLNPSSFTSLPPAGHLRRDPPQTRPRQDEVPQDRQRQQSSRLHRQQGSQASLHRGGRYDMGLGLYREGKGRVEKGRLRAD